MKYPLGIQSFPDIIEGNYAYIDKTALVHQLIEQGKWYFLSRPRRFGKSLLVSTFQNLFEGNKALFKNLAITNTSYEFKSHPVLKFEFSQAEISTADDFRAYVETVIDAVALKNQLNLTTDRYDFKLVELIQKLREKSATKVVLLVDEYDKPILNTFNTPKNDEVRRVMNAFYASIKSLDDDLRFVFITGVSKFSKVSVFSGMNNLNDISADSDYITICGYTKSELKQYFHKPVLELGFRETLNEKEIYEKIADWYNGYVFSENEQGVYNPFSILSLLIKKKFQNYWYQTATPTFLIELLKTKQYLISDLEQFRMGVEGFNSSDPETTSIQSLLVQTGYLTIKSWDGAIYTLGFPNKEVKESFYREILERYACVDSGNGRVYIDDIRYALSNGDLPKLFKCCISVFFAGVPYDIAIRQERYYQSLFFAIFRLLGAQIETEVTTNKGRIDAVIKTDKTIYIIEFKLNGSKEQALQQIKDNQYPQKYQNEGKEICMIGVEFDEKERNVGGWIDERF